MLNLLNHWYSREFRYVKILMQYVVEINKEYENSEAWGSAILRRSKLTSIRSWFISSYIKAPSVTRHSPSSFSTCAFECVISLSQRLFHDSSRFIATSHESIETWKRFEQFQKNDQRFFVTNSVVQYFDVSRYPLTKILRCKIITFFPSI